MNSEVQVGQATSLKLADEVDYSDIRKQLWKATDMMYKYAVSSLNSKQNYFAQHPKPSHDANVPEQLSAPAFTFAAPSVLTPNCQATDWKKIADRLSAVFTDFPILYDTQVTIENVAGDVYRLTNEPVDMRLPIGYTRIEAHAKAKCNDGSVIDDYWYTLLDVAATAPNEELLIAEIKAFASQLAEKRQAEAINEYYSGPILYEDEAVATSFVNNVVKPILVAKRTLQDGSGTNSMRSGKRILDAEIQIS